MSSLIRKIERADLRIDGVDKKQSRTSVLLKADSIGLEVTNSQDLNYARKLGALERTLKV